MINKIGQRGIDNFRQKGFQVAGSEQDDSKVKNSKFEKTDSESSESIKETINALKHSIAQNRNDGRVQYDMSNLNNQDDNDLKFL